MHVHTHIFCGSCCNIWHHFSSSLWHHLYTLCCLFGAAWLQLERNPLCSSSGGISCVVQELSWSMWKAAASQGDVIRSLCLQEGEDGRPWVLDQITRPTSHVTDVATKTELCLASGGQSQRNLQSGSRPWGWELWKHIISDPGLSGVFAWMCVLVCVQQRRGISRLRLMHADWLPGHVQWWCGQCQVKLITVNERPSNLGDSLGTTSRITAPWQLFTLTFFTHIHPQKHTQRTHAISFLIPQL